MKGRRRARRSALQALYELDQSAHPLDAVIDGRLREFYFGGAQGAVDRQDRELLERLIDVLAGGGFGSVDGLDAEEVARLDAEPDRLAAVLDVLRQLDPHAEYCAQIVRGVTANKVPLDAMIHEIAPEWPVEQMAPVDRNILRIALWEMARETSPLRVAINEAVELARAFSGEGARRMVNGALGAFAARNIHLELPRDSA